MFNSATRKITRITYQNILKPVLFTIDPEIVHERMTGAGEFLGNIPLARKATAAIYSKHYKELDQTINNINFSGPVGLSAGFDYDARLTRITPSIGFGFHTVGTITREKYNGNPGPILGRLPLSQSLMVNKGFKNKGVEQITQKLTGQKFEIPIGISIGRTNSKSLTTHRDCVADIISSFIICEDINMHHSYYELNISCPNLLTSISFYDSVELGNLLKAIDNLGLKRPLYIKMPIECTNEVTVSLLDTIQKHKVQGVIFGNLQKNRHDESLNQLELARFPKGNFSGKPTQKRSNELISLTYRLYKDRFIIIGTGGIFSAEDAYTKIKLGASIVQLITGMIYKGPQLISEINQDLVILLKKDGFNHISQAIGKA